MYFYQKTKMVMAKEYKTQLKYILTNIKDIDNL
jgi:hypothetical protein